MRGPRRPILQSDLTTGYTPRFLAALAVVLLFAIAVFKWWPVPDAPAEEPVFAEESPVLMFMEEIDRTRHRAGVPPPPRPVIPNPVPSDQPVDEQILLPDIVIPDAPLTGSGLKPGNAPAGEGGEPMEKPSRPAGVIKIVEPSFPKEAQDAGIHATIFVTFLVGTDGGVEEVFVNEIRVFDRTGKYTVQRQLGYGLVDLTLQAASGWKFRPARHDGKPVRSYVRHEFTFGR